MGTMAGSTKRVAFEGVLTAGHKGPAVEVAFDPATELGAQEVALWPGRRGFPVEVLLNGTRFRSAIVPRMHRWFVLIDESLARRAGSRIGARVRLTVWADGAFTPTSAMAPRAEPSARLSADPGPRASRPERPTTSRSKRRPRTRG